VRGDFIAWLSSPRSTPNSGCSRELDELRVA
jgi:hypothetical protein